MTLKGQTEAHLYRPRDCSAYVRSRWLFDRTTAYYQNMPSLSTFVCARNDGVSPVTLNPPVEAQAPISRAAALSSVLYPPCCVPLQRAETSSRLLLGLGIWASGLEKHEDVVAWSGPSFGQRGEQWREGEVIMQCCVSSEAVEVIVR
ncbi:hypothetical protein K458DRAFT_423273 [Lentithecium fluviatile CBS 122367]|uniref:Uncharacterized protein n=1 Tax=Lentithecium fluviatile CBS 122367 TaxID=1168545 RepID=A0A6G1IJL5_9PLEO|nr:hypothetical protein K458DRAFT_423273 [Lentithecium fluviatile CBS 122367]